MTLVSFANKQTNNYSTFSFVFRTREIQNTHRHTIHICINSSSPIIFIEILSAAAGAALSRNDGNDDFRTIVVGAAHSLGPQFNDGDVTATTSDLCHLMILVWWKYNTITNIALRFNYLFFKNKQTNKQTKRKERLYQRNIFITLIDTILPVTHRRTQLTALKVNFRLREHKHASQYTVLFVCAEFS